MKRLGKLRLWPARSLGRRLVGALLLAFALIAVLVVAMNYWTARQDMARQSSASQLGSLLARSLEGIQDESAARVVLRGFMSEFERLRRDMDWEGGTISLQLSRPDGGLVFASGPPIEAPVTWPEGMSLQQMGGVRHAAYLAEGPRWTLQVLDPLPSDAVLLRWLLEQVGVSLLMALPVLLLTLWLAVRSGLRPLRAFTARMAALDTQRELRPLDLDLRYAELQPLGQAFDTLLARLREQLALERAFVQDAAHELRTPLAALGAQTHVLMHSRDEANRQLAAQALQQGVRRTAHLSQQLLDLAALDPARSQPADEWVDLGELCGWVLRQAHPVARRRRVKLAFDGPEHLSWRGDRRALQSLLQNLVDNALRYGAREVQLQLSTEPTGVHLAVRDDGPGVPVAEREHMFERFWRGPQREEPGTGLGLAIARQAAERLGAQLYCGPGLEGRGIGFELVLPVAGVP